MEREAGEKLGVFNGLVIWNIVFEYKWAIFKSKFYFSHVFDILNATKNFLNGLFCKKEAREITSFTGFSGLF